MSGATLKHNFEIKHYPKGKNPVGIKHARNEHQLLGFQKLDDSFNQKSLP
jgi:hypothetical protein